MAETAKPQPLVVPDNDPLAKEHAAIGLWVGDALESLAADHAFFVTDVDPKTIPSGQIVMAGDAEQSRRYALAALAQAIHWDQLAIAARGRELSNEQWGQLMAPRRQIISVLNALLRRSLPFDRSDLLALVNWCCLTGGITSRSYPIGGISKALQRYAAANTVDEEFRTALQKLVVTLRANSEKECQKQATVIEQLYVGQQPEVVPAATSQVQPQPTPGPAGLVSVLNHLKRALGMLPKEPVPAMIEVATGCDICADSPLRAEHKLLSELLLEADGSFNYRSADLRTCEIGRQVFWETPAARGRLLLASAERHVSALLPTSRSDNYADLQLLYAAAGVATALLELDLELDRAGVFDTILYLSILSPQTYNTSLQSTQKMLAFASREAGVAPLTEGERFVLSLFRTCLIKGPLLGKSPDDVVTLTRLINDGASFFLVPGEAWSDRTNADLTQFDASLQGRWTELLRHALTATSSRPSAKWLKTAGQLVEAIGETRVHEVLQRWFPLVSAGQSIRKFGSYFGDARGSADTMHEENANCLRGLLWCVPLLSQRDELARLVTTVALSAYKKVPGVGPRAVKVGNGAVYALSELATKEAVGQLAMLKVRVKFGTAQKEIEKAFDSAAAALELPRDQIEELGVPSYGMEEVGRRVEELGGYQAELFVTGSDAELKWSDANGKSLKSVPAKVKSDYQEDFKDLQQSLKDVQSMLPAQRDRIDGLFLLQKSWSISEWKERYHDHPLVGTIARRLLWCIDGTPALFSKGVPCDVQGESIQHGKTAEVTLWHPVGRSINDITGWRRRLEELSITQPFKQAHREIYLLTDAERNTATYSNRYAAHIIRQHQFNALCAARGWKNKLRLMVDDTYPPAIKELPQWGLRAEFWVEGVGDAYGTDTNESGVYLRLATDQVRFYRSEAASNYAHASGGSYSREARGPGRENIDEALSLADVPPLVFSEIMRDVDLFVGVASVGNDPTWQDGGPQGHYRDYWQSYSFGELSGTATTRKQVLERLVPRLKIARQCSFSDRFLVVKGQKRTYKIHLGSGNILMEPNDQYLCIVPDSKARAAQDDLYLPFEGDSTLSIIISKALLLADDTKIKDPTITRQINA